MSMSPEKLTEELKSLYGDNLKSVTLYGSAASGDYSAKFSDFNILVVLGEITLADLRKGQKVVHRWVRQGNPPPLMFTADRLRASVDVFPMEISDIKEFHKVMYGENPVAGLEVKVENLRLELERELKGKLIQLRERFMDCAGVEGDDRTILKTVWRWVRRAWGHAGVESEERALLARSSSTFLTLFRHALRLIGESPLPPKREAAKALARRLGYDSAIFDHIRTLRETGKLPPGVKAGDLMVDYLPFIEHVVDAVDGWVHGEPFPEVGKKQK